MQVRLMVSLADRFFQMFLSLELFNILASPAQDDVIYSDTPIAHAFFPSANSGLALSLLQRLPHL